MFRVALLALALIVTPAFADPPEEDLTTAPGSIATPMIGEAHAIGVLEIAHNGQVSVRHLASGMRCDFERDGEGGQIVLFPGPPRGVDVACDNRSDTYVTLYPTRYPAARSLDDVLSEAEAAIRHRYRDAQLTPTTLEGQTDDLPEQRSRHFIIALDGRHHLTSVGVAQANGWTYKVRYTAPVEGDNVQQQPLMAGLLLTSLLLELNETP